MLSYCGASFLLPRPKKASSGICCAFKIRVYEGRVINAVQHFTDNDDILRIVGRDFLSSLTVVISGSSACFDVECNKCIFDAKVDDIYMHMRLYLLVTFRLLFLQTCVLRQHHTNQQSLTGLPRLSSSISWLYMACAGTQHTSRLRPHK